MEPCCPSKTARRILVMLLILVSLNSAASGDSQRVDSMFSPCSTFVAAEILVNMPVILPDNAADLRTVAGIETAQGIAFSANSTRMAVSGKEGIAVYDTDSLNRIAVTGRIDKHGYPSFCFSADGELLAWSYHGDNAVQIWNASRGALVKKLLQTENPVTFSEDRRLLATKSNSFQIWNIENDSMLFEHAASEASRPKISSDWNTVAFDMPDLPIRVELLNVADNKNVKTLTGFTTAAPAWNSMFSPGWKHVAWISRTQIRIMDVATGQFTLDLSPYSNAKFSADGEVIACAESGWIYAPPSLGKVMILDLSSGDTLAVLQHSEHVSDFAFSPDGWLIAVSTSEEKDNIHLWDWASEEKLLTLTRSTEGRTDIRFSPDGRLLILGADDGFRLLGIVP